MRPGTLALVITYYGIYPHYCAGNGQITANQLVIQDGENTITSVNGNVLIGATDTNAEKVSNTAAVYADVLVI